MRSKYDFAEPPRTIEVNASAKIAVGKVLVVGVSIYSTSVVPLAIMYDGNDASGRRLKSLGALTNLSMQFTMEHGVFFEHGLFITVDAATTFLSISYYTLFEPEGDRTKE